MRLSENMKSLTKNIINSKNVRNNEIKKIAADAKKITIDTKKVMEGFAEADKARASDLRKDLKSSKLELRKNVSSMISGFAEADKTSASDVRKDLKSSKLELKKNVSGMVSGFAEADKARARDLQKDLKNFKQGLEKSVNSLLGDYKSDRVEAANAWRMVTGTLGKKSAASVQPEEKKKSPEVEPVVKAVVAPEPKRAPEVKPVVKAVVAPDFEAQVLKIIQQNSHGIKIERIQKFTGIPAIKLNIVISKLFSDGKISKKENKYFPGKR